MPWMIGSTRGPSTSRVVTRRPATLSPAALSEQQLAMFTGDDAVKDGGKKG